MKLIKRKKVIPLDDTGFKRLVRMWGNGHAIAKRIIKATGLKFHSSEWENEPGIRNSKCYCYHGSRHVIEYGINYCFIWVNKTV